MGKVSHFSVDNQEKPEINFVSTFKGVMNEPSTDTNGLYPHGGLPVLKQGMGQLNTDNQLLEQPSGVIGYGSGKERCAGEPHCHKSCHGNGQARSRGVQSP